MTLPLLIPYRSRRISVLSSYECKGILSVCCTRLYAIICLTQFIDPLWIGRHCQNRRWALLFYKVKVNTVVPPDEPLARDRATCYNNIFY